MPAKHTYEFVKQYFEERGCELLEEEYVGARIKMEYRCSCENISKICFSSFQQGHRCRKCAIERNVKKTKRTFKYVYNYFEKQGCELLEKEYINSKTKMRYKCSCGNISETIFNSFQQGYRCQKCGRNEKFTFKYVYDYFEEYGCKLLETTYINNQTKMSYICKCGDENEITFNKFLMGRRCGKCGVKKQTQTMMKKYGVPCFPSSGYSKESQKLFNAIYKKTNIKNKIYYATLNKEFGIRYKGKWFSYDYVNSKFKKAIEYNGSIFHPQPHQKDNEIGWFAFDKNKTVKEARDYEKIKYEGLEKRGYQILTIWDYELHKDLDTLVQKCLDFLTV